MEQLSLFYQEFKHELDLFLSRLTIFGGDALTLVSMKPLDTFNKTLGHFQLSLWRHYQELKPKHIFS